MGLRTFTRWRRRPFAIVASVLVVVSVVEQVRLVVDLTRRYTNWDQTGVWLHGSDWLSGNPRQLTFYGQRYGTSLDGIPVELVHLLGFSYGTALPLALVAMTLGSWWLLAYTAARRGWRTAALLALAAPILLPTETLVTFGVYAMGVGRLLAAGAVALALVPGPRPVARAVLAVAAGGLALQLDASTALLVVPLFAWMAPEWIRARRVEVLAGVVPPLAYRAFVDGFHDRNPDYVVHPEPPVEMSWAVLEANLAEIDLSLGPFALHLAPSGILLVVAVVAVLAVAGRNLDVRAAAAVVAFAAVAAVGLSLPRAEFMAGASAYYPAYRTMLPLPLGVWLVAALALDPARRRRVPAPVAALGRLAPALVVSLALFTALVRAGGHDAAVERLAAEARNDPVVPAVAVRDVMSTCTALASLDPELVIFPDHSTQAYACEATHSLRSVYPRYERRAWMLHEAAEGGQRDVVVWDVGQADCSVVLDGGPGTCEPVLDGRAIRILDGPPPLEIATRLGVDIRPFQRIASPTGAEEVSGGT